MEIIFLSAGIIIGICFSWALLAISNSQIVKKMRSKNKKLREINKNKDDFLSIASHQLRTPLTSVKGYISLILDGDAGEINDLQRRFLTEAYDSSERMVRVIGDFLNVSRLQTGKFEIQKEQGDFVKIIESELSGLQEMAKMREIKLEFLKNDSKIEFFADFDKLRQVAMNMIDNAIYYSPSKTKVEISLEKSDNFVIFKVKDNGIGVPKSQQEKLFSKFYRADNAKKKRPDGTGVGLYLAKEVVKGHGGEIIFESQEGKGSVFGFKIPFEKTK